MYGGKGICHVYVCCSQTSDFNVLLAVRKWLFKEMIILQSWKFFHRLVVLICCWHCVKVCIHFRTRPKCSVISPFEALDAVVILSTKCLLTILIHSTDHMYNLISVLTYNISMIMFILERVCRCGNDTHYIQHMNLIYLCFVMNFVFIALSIYYKQAA